MKLLRRVPWIVWALLAPALVLVVRDLVVGDGVPIDVVGAGPALAAMNDAPPPVGGRWRLDLVPGEPPEATARRVDRAIASWPEVLVVGFDLRGAVPDGGYAALRGRLEDAARGAENATAVPVMVSPSPLDPSAPDAAALRTWFRETFCRRRGLRVCVDVTERPTDEIPEAIRRAAAEGLERHQELRESTQTSSRTPRRPTLPAAGVWGVALGMFPRAARRADQPFPPPLDELRALGARDVLVPVRAAVDGLGGSQVRRGRLGLPPSTVRQVALGARHAGLRVVPYPLLDVEGTGDPKAWRGRLRPRDPDRFWASYGDWVETLAVLAQDLDAPVLPIGVELGSLATPTHRNRWAALARRARRHYHGPLAFVGNHDALGPEQAAPFEAVDVAGVSAYFPLAERPERRWRPLAARWDGAVRPALEGLGRRTGRPVVIFEVGYPSRVGGTVRPWDDVSGAPVDLAEQAAAYRAATETLSSIRGLGGAFFWNWFGAGGPLDRHYTPRGKPAARWLGRFFSSLAE